MDRIKIINPNLGEEELNAVERVFKSGWLTQGPITREFEDSFAQYLGVRNAITTTSCTTALHLALLALDIKSGDEVIVPDFTFPATVNVIYHVGAKPVLLDIDLRTYNIDPEKIEAAISKKTKAIMPVHLFGQSAEIKVIMEIAQTHGLHVIEDAACGMGSKHYGKKVGTFGDAACFSFHPRKILSIGEGGMLVTNNDELAEKARVIKDHGKRKDLGTLGFVYPGYNFRMSDVSSAIGLVQLKKVDLMVARRIELAGVYDELLVNEDGVVRPECLPQNNHTYQTYCLLVRKDNLRDSLIASLAAKNIETQIGTYAYHLQPFYTKQESVANSGLHRSEKAFEKTLVLPLYDGLTEEQQVYVCSNLRALLQA